MNLVRICLLIGLAIGAPGCGSARAGNATAAAAKTRDLSADPYGFGGWLNAVRAGYGLGPVSYDPGLSMWAGANNVEQQARGLGHYVMGPARRQNSGMGRFDQMGPMWMASPAHRSALLDPSIRRYGISGLGQWFTFNAN